MTNRITIRRPDDWHLHVRDGKPRAVLPYSAKVFGRAILMPNLVPPVRSTADAIAYRERVKGSAAGRVALPTADDMLSHR